MTSSSFSPSEHDQAQPDISNWLPATTRSEPATRGVSLLKTGLSIVRRRKWLIAAFVGVALVIGILVTILATPQYTATAIIEIQRENRNLSVVKGADDSASASAGMDAEFYQTQYGLLASRSLAERVVDQLRLADSEPFFQSFSKKSASAWFANGRPVATAPNRDARRRAAASILLQNIDVTPGRNSRLVTLAFTGPDASFSKKLVDTWAAQFIQQTLARRFDTTSYARHFLEQRLEQLRARIDESERQLVDYASRQSIVNLPGETNPTTGTTSERSLVADDLSSLNRELSQATADRIRAESRLQGGADQSTEALQNSTISQLRGQRVSLAAEYAKMLVQFEPGYPPARAIRQQLGQIDQAISREEQRVSGSLRGVYTASTMREDALANQVKQLEKKVLDFRRRSIQYNIYQRDADTNRQLYDALLQRYKEIGVAGGVGVNNISIVDTAELPVRPSSPLPLLNLGVALLMGLLLGTVAAVILEQLDDRLRNPDDVQKLLGVPLLGTIPKSSSADLMATLQDAKSSLSEAYLSLQTNLAFSTSHGVPKTLAVTSSQPAEGKSTTSVALARSLSRLGKSVVLIDSDMRSPSIHHLFGVENQRGVSNYLSGDDALDTLLLQPGGDALTIMTAGPQPPSAAELLTGDRLASLLRILSNRFDHVIIDVAPVMGLADAPLVGSAVEGMVFVFDSQSTRSHMAQVALERLFGSRTHVLGAVLTKYDSKTNGTYGYGYGYGYGYEYGQRGQAG